MHRAYYCPFAEQSFLSFLMEEGREPDYLSNSRCAGFLKQAVSVIIRWLDRVRI